MARIQLSNELKEAIVDLPDKEKNKLLFRLIAKDGALVNKLIFQLLEAGESTETRREDVRMVVEKSLSHEAAHFFSPGYLLLVMRSLSGEITRHVATTRDRYGEIELNFFLLNRSFDLMGHELTGFSWRKTQTLTIYVVKRALKLLTLLGKQHPDVHLDFREEMEELGNSIGEHDYFMQTAVHLGLDVNYLLRGEVPD